MTKGGELAWSRVGVILLAGGRATRFGSDKLSATLCGKRVLDHAAEALSDLEPAGKLVVLGPTTPAPAVPTWHAVRLEQVGLPQSASLSRGVEALDPNGLDAILIALGDMPLVSRGHLEALRAAFDGSGPVCSGAAAMRCPPALFPVGMRAQLLGREGDRGARVLLSGAQVVRASGRDLLDVDEPVDLARAEGFLRGLC